MNLWIMQGAAPWKRLQKQNGRFINCFYLYFTRSLIYCPFPLCSVTHYDFPNNEREMQIWCSLQQNTLFENAFAAQIERMYTHCLFFFLSLNLTVFLALNSL
jgi:hypothetical protein